MNNFEQKVLKTIEKYCMINPSDKILVGLSGGADSCSLLLALINIKNELSLKFEIFACHVNHMIRKGEAERDQEFCRNLCLSVSIPFYTENVNVPEISDRNGTGLEEAARNERYSYFSSLCKKFSFTKIATAHTLSDNAETLIFNLARGTGIDGLCGIPPVRGNIIRPLIDITRTEVEEYLKEKKQPFVTDSTNFSPEYSRNLIRNYIIPEIKKINPSFESSCLKTSDLLRCDKNFLNTLAAEKKTYNTREIASLPFSLMSRLVISLYSDISNCSLSYINIKSVCKGILDVVFDKKTRFISLPNDIYAKITPLKISFLLKKDYLAEKKELSSFSFNITLKNGKNILNDMFALYIDFQNVNKFLPETLTDKSNIYKLYKNTTLFSDKINGDLKARNRLSKDSYKVRGVTKSVKKMFSDIKIPEYERAFYPVLCDNDGVVTSFGMPVCDRCYIKDGRKNINIGLYKCI